MVFRVFIYVPPGSNEFGPYANVCGSIVNGCYNTGRFDEGTGLCGDPKQFDNIASMTAYAQANGETLYQAKTVEEVNALCTARAAAAPKPPQVIQPTAPAAGLPAPPPVGLVAIPTNEPGIPGSGAPTIQVTESNAGPEFTGKQSEEDMAIYRLILETAPNRVDTGATYPGCSQANASACKPMQFVSINDAVQFAKDHGEIPVRVNSVSEAWAIVEGRKPIDEANIITGSGNTLLLVGAAVAAAVVLPKLLKGKSA